VLARRETSGRWQYRDKGLIKEDNAVDGIPDPLPDVAISVGAVAVARRAHELGLTLTPEQCDELARAALEAGTQYLEVDEEEG